MHCDTYYEKDEGELKEDLTDLILKLENNCETFPYLEDKYKNNMTICKVSCICDANLKHMPKRILFSQEFVREYSAVNFKIPPYLEAVDFLNIIGDEISYLWEYAETYHYYGILCNEDFIITLTSCPWVISFFIPFLELEEGNEDKFSEEMLSMLKCYYKYWNKPFFAADVE